MNTNIQPVFFASPLDFRKWLEKNFDIAKEIFVGFYKVGSGKKNMTWGESVDQALCFGWIDGIRKSLGKESYFIRFTPRKPNSIWSKVNINKIEILKKKRLMKPSGLSVYNLRKESKSEIYAYEKELVKLPKNFEEQFKANKKAWSFFECMPASYQKTALYWVMSAKQYATKTKRLTELIMDSEAGQKIKILNY